ncbi:hypothetical protein A3B40_01225 [Candidatus Roizmanbacteria bacterium RIFCSPLOWO2_01_FULL_37_16]|uniref:Uncharacterized protein n=1 Tax=Candidatus Roizmanbacteria bacterium RIFCSPLOWO2_01_FULL_37_16 TaxID=1802058 RepID=A0A1F7INV8_9BACT|nr:MAG: hypothetical protein A3B40_01225 [Candidatus Roizmanbacteria bacterium RIFCSPLOWO2_01_FULL_37_16]
MIKHRYLKHYFQLLEASRPEKLSHGIEDHFLVLFGLKQFIANGLLKLNDYEDLIHSSNGYDL